MRRILLPLLAIPALAALVLLFWPAGEPSPVIAGDIPVFSADGAAIRGYDPVAYFTDGRPVEGRSEHRVVWNHAEWHFASAANAALFTENPDKYAPEYGGHCAYALAKGDLVSIDPNAWSIRDDRLFLNYSPDIRARWEQDVDGYVQSADSEWRSIINSP